MNNLVTCSADDQSFASASGHPSDPRRFFALPWSVQVGEFTDMVNFTVLRAATQLAYLCQKALHHLTATIEYGFGVIVEDGVFLPSQLNASEPRYQGMFHIPVNNFSENLKKGSSSTMFTV
jgi:hypothetical protein